LQTEKQASNNIFHTIQGDLRKRHDVPFIELGFSVEKRQ
jgi:hypothetical protein